MRTRDKDDIGFEKSAGQPILTRAARPQGSAQERTINPALSAKFVVEATALGILNAPGA